jgi:hypothetical protein
LSISVILWALSGIAIFAVGLGLLSYSVFHNQDASPYPLIALFSSWLVICISVWVILIGVFGWHLFGISIPRHANRDFIPHGLVRVLPDGRENIDWSLVLCIVRLSQNPSAKSSDSAEQARPQYEPSRKSIGRAFFSEPPYPRRPLTGPSGLAALLCALPGILTGVIGFLLLFSPHRRPNLGAFLFLFGIAVMFASLTLLSLTQLRLSSANSLQFHQAAERSKSVRHTYLGNSNGSISGENAETSREDISASAILFKNSRIRTEWANPAMVGA